MNSIPEIRIIEPLSLALNRTREMLFRPFDAGKWFTVGFCAFLAMLGEGGGMPGSFGGGSHGEHRRGTFTGVSDVWSSVMPYLPFILLGIAAAIVIGIGLAVLFAWLRGRGQFMFLDCIARNAARVVEPWRQYRPEGNSIFRLYLILLLIFGGLILLIVVGGIAGVLLSLGIPGAGPVIALSTGIICLLLIVPLAMLCALIHSLTKYFVVPIMYCKRTGWREGWSRLWELILRHPGHFVLWLLVLWVINLAISLGILLAVLGSCCLCCIGCCIVPIACLPYINTVVLLPLHVFRRCYALYFLSQFDPQFDVFVRT